MNGQLIQMLPSDGALILPSILSWGMDVIRAIQALQNPALTSFIKFLSALGSQVLFVPVILAIYWIIDERRGLRLAILVIISAWLNLFLKDLLRQPRPFFFDPSLGLAHESTYALPSGHAQMSLIFFVSLAAWFNEAWPLKVLKDQGRKLIWAAMIMLLLSIGFTRIYLGVHFPSDIFFGWAVGGIILALGFFASPVLEKRLSSGGPRIQNLAAAILVLLMNTIYSRGIMLSAVFLGACLGYTLMRKYVSFHAQAEVNGKRPGILVYTFRCFTGFLGCGIIYLGLGFILPGEGSLFSDFPLWGRSSPYIDLGIFIRYGLLGLWAFAGVPRFFMRMGLASAPGDIQQSE